VEVLSDADVQARVTPEMARAAMRAAIVAAYEGRLNAPPRTVVGLGDRRLTLTCGSVDGAWYGYRSYTAPGSTDEDQLVVVHDATTGAVTALAVGAALGPRRVGAIGAVALDAFAPARPTAIAVLGTGRQAWHQLWALRERFRSLPVRAYSPTEAHRHDFAARATVELGLHVLPAASVREAVDDANVIVVATSSGTPVLGPGDIDAGAYVTTLGPKQVGRSEIGPDLVRDAALVVTDSPAQLRSYDPPHVLAGSPPHGGDGGDDNRGGTGGDSGVGGARGGGDGRDDDGVAGAESGGIVHLGAVLTGAVPVPDGTRVFLSVGLAGTEAWLLHAAASRR